MTRWRGCATCAQTKLGASWGCLQDAQQHQESQHRAGWHALGTDGTSAQWRVCCLTSGQLVPVPPGERGMLKAVPWQATAASDAGKAPLPVVQIAA